jgi:hypothetical protein
MCAFAMLLKIDSGSLSQIMSERRHPSGRIRNALLLSLGFTDAERERVSVTLELMARERRLLWQVAQARVRPSSRYFARRLRLSVDDVNAALTQLLCRGLIRMVPGGRWIVNVTPQ